MKQFVSAMFMLMAGAVFADTVSVAALDAKIRGMMDENMTVGMSVVVVKGDKVVYQQAFGYRDKDTREPLDVNDIFRIASISKSDKVNGMHGIRKCLHGVFNLLHENFIRQ